MAQIPKLPECNNVLIFGPVSSGKTWLLDQWINSMERSVVIDTTAAFMDARFCHIWHSPRAYLLTLAQNPYSYRISYHPASRNFYEDFRWCVEGIWLSAKRTAETTSPLPRWLIVDEVHEVCGINNVTHEMDTVIRYARHNLLGFIGTTQRISDVDRSLTQSARVVVLFHTTEGVDLEAIRKRYGKEVEEAVRNLRPCIYDEVNKIVKQEPQCLVYMRGQGFTIYELGDKKLTQENTEECLQEKVLAAVPNQEAPKSLEVHSGKKELPLEESLVESGPQE